MAPNSQRGLKPSSSPNNTTWKKLLRSYSSSYLREETQAEALTRYIEGLSRFSQVVASRSSDFSDVGVLNGALSNFTEKNMKQLYSIWVKANVTSMIVSPRGLGPKESKI